MCLVEINRITPGGYGEPLALLSLGYFIDLG